MWPDRVSNLGPLTYESGALPTALRGPAEKDENIDSELSQLFLEIRLQQKCFCKIVTGVLWKSHLEISSVYLSQTGT